MNTHLHAIFYCPLTVGSVAVLLLLAGCGRSSAPLAPAIEVESTSSALAANETNYSETDFPAWRNIDQDGVENERDVPVEWSADRGVLWSAEVPGKGHSSPIICNERIFLTAGEQTSETQSVLAYDQSSGEKLWQTVVHQSGLPAKHGKNSHASATPACDAEHVYAAFINSGGLHLSALDHEGNIAWQREVGPFESEHGFGSSVLLWKGLLFLNGDSRGNGYIAAINSESGELVWRTPRPGPGRHGSYATPIVAQLGGRDQLILAGYGRVTSYDPATGAEIWHCDGPAEVMANTLAFRDPLVIASGGYPEKEILCVDASGSGDVTETHVKWSASRNVGYVPSPTLVGDRLYSMADNGVVACFTLDGGEMLWNQRLGGDFSASPLVVGKRFYVPDESGLMFVFEVEPQYKLLAKNRLDDQGGMASLAVSGNHLFVRTASKLYCLGGE